MKRNTCIFIGLFAAIFFVGSLLMVSPRLVRQPSTFKADCTVKIAVITKSLAQDWKTNKIPHTAEVLLKMRYMADSALKKKVYGHTVTEKFSLKQILVTETKHLNNSLFPKVLRVRRETKEEKIEDPEKKEQQLDSEVNFTKQEFIPCQVPKRRLQTAQILCNEFSTTKVCKSHCAYGFTFPEGIVRMHVCSLKQNTWSKPFEECKQTKEEKIEDPEKLEQQLDSEVYFTKEELAPCQVPKGGLKTAEILCNQFPTTKVCKSHCAYGLTFPEGIVRMHVCSLKQNTWTKPFEECKPFVDCNVRLVSPGTLRCTINTLTESPFCRIRCGNYEDKKAIRRHVYSCKTDGTWKPPLPFCVTLEGVPLAKAPNVTEHVSFTYPKSQGEPNDVPRSEPWILT